LAKVQRVHSSCPAIAALRGALGEIRAPFGPAAVLVNNAANDQRYEFDQITPEQFDRTIAVNFRHVFFAAQAIVPQMRELGYGSIVNMSSVSWMRGIPLLEAYASAKAAIVGFTNTLARALGPHRIRVNAIAPGTEDRRTLPLRPDHLEAEVDPTALTICHGTDCQRSLARRFAQISPSRPSILFSAAARRRAM
jgi:NAD(P)-dependent dehydrogenase (short-subunit alcohol dehydrogenase family)